MDSESNSQLGPKIPTAAGMEEQKGRLPTKWKSWRGFVESAQIKGQSGRSRNNPNTNVRAETAASNEQQATFFLPTSQAHQRICQDINIATHHPGSVHCNDTITMQQVIEKLGPDKALGPDENR